MPDQERPTLTQYDKREHYYCPILGDSIHFSYCRKMNENLPCRKLYTCWTEKIDVDAYVKENFSEEEIQKVFAQPAPGRVETMFDVLNRVLEEKKQKES